MEIDIFFIKKAEDEDVAVLNERIPDRLEVCGNFFRLDHEFRTRFCHNYNEFHPKNVKCTIEEKYEKLREQSVLPTKTRIISDSTLRHANELAIQAGVTAMPGGGIGQLANAVALDPQAEHVEHVIIVGGANDLKFYANEEFVHAINEGAKKNSKVTEE